MLVDLGTLAVMLTAVTLREGNRPVAPGPVLLVFSLLAWLPVPARTRFPLPALVATVVAESLHLIVVPYVAPGLTAPIAVAAYQPVPVATMVTAWTVASRRPWRQGIGSGAAAATVLTTVSLVARPLRLLATDMVMFDLVAIATGLGVWVTLHRDRAARLAREREVDTARQVAAERLRIARELHDVLAHRLTLVNAQAGVAEYLLRSDPRSAAQALHDITRNTRQALDELRATVGLLRQEGPDADDRSARSPLPDLQGIEGLAQELRTAGTAVSSTVTGTPRPLTPGGDLAAYRIVQEALTNAAKHSPGAEVDVVLEWSDRGLAIRVANGPAPGCPPGHRGPGTGHGLIGMTERAHACGGTLQARVPPGGGFVVLATLPAGPAGGDEDDTASGDAAVTDREGLLP